MLNLKNFETQVAIVILKRGEAYFQNGNVTELEDEGNGDWSATVEGSETYLVELSLKRKDEITDYSCDCPYDGGICKHVVAALFRLRNEIVNTPAKPAGNTKKKLFQTLIKSVTHTEYQKFVFQYALSNKDFKTEFELFFADKDNRINVAKKYSELIKKVIKKHSSGGYVDYRSTFNLSVDIEKFLGIGDEYLAKNNFVDAFALCTAVLSGIKEVLTYCDDSNGNIGECIGNTIELLSNIISAKEAAITTKEAVFIYLQKELDDKDYFDYGDFGYNLFSVFKNIAIQLDYSTVFLEFTNAKIAGLNGKHDEYRREFFQKEIIDFLLQSGKTAEAEKLVEQNMDIVEVRMEVMNKSIAKKEYDVAKKIILAGIKIAESKLHPGTVDKWKKELLRIAKLENDIPAIRNYTKYFAFDRGVIDEYYKEWKNTFTPADWKQTIENHIAETIQKVTSEWSKNKNRVWQAAAHPPLLQNLGQIYIHESFWDRILVLVQQENSLNTTLSYHPYLVHDYPMELLSIYLPALEEYGLKANTRTNYEELVRIMRRIIKDIPQSKKEVLAVAIRLKVRFSSNPRRPAMLQELDGLLK